VRVSENPEQDALIFSRALELLRYVQFLEPISRLQPANIVVALSLLVGITEQTGHTVQPSHPVTSTLASFVQYMTARYVLSRPTDSLSQDAFARIEGVVHMAHALPLSLMQENKVVANTFNEQRLVALTRALAPNVRRALWSFPNHDVSIQAASMIDQALQTHGADLVRAFLARMDDLDTIHLSPLLAAVFASDVVLDTLATLRLLLSLDRAMLIPILIQTRALRYEQPDIMIERTFALMRPIVSPLQLPALLDSVQATNVEREMAPADRSVSAARGLAILRVRLAELASQPDVLARAQEALDRILRAATTHTDRVVNMLIAADSVDLWLRFNQFVQSAHPDLLIAFVDVVGDLGQIEAMEQKARAVRGPYASMIAQTVALDHTLRLAQEALRDAPVDLASAARELMDQAETVAQNLLVSTLPVQRAKMLKYVMELMGDDPSRPFNLDRGAVTAAVERIARALAFDLDGPFVHVSLIYLASGIIGQTPPAL
jgi:hypothetical protein